MSSLLSITIKRALHSAIILSLFASALTADPLWEQAERLVLNSPILVPGEVETHQLVFDGKGDQQVENQLLFETLKDPATGVPHGVLKQLLENNKDKTEKSRKEVEQDFQGELNSIERDFPFHLENPSDAVTEKREETKIILDRECVGYDFVVTKSDGEDEEPSRFAGTVWIDPNTAVPLEIESHMLDLPRKEEGAEIVSVVINRQYGYENGSFITLSEQQQLWLNAKFLFKKIVVYMESETHYRKHWQWEK